MACGTGKTLVGLLVAEATESTGTLVLVPSPSLLAQTLREWTANAERAFATSRSARMRRWWARTQSCR
jgi:predicted helicase